MKGKISQAIQAYKKVLVQDHDNIMARYDLGLVYRNGGELKKAVSEFEKVIKIDSQHFDCQNILGLLYDQLCVPQKAISFYQEALKINPGYIQGHNNLGMVYLKMNNLDLAVQEFQQTLSKSRDPMITSFAQGNLGKIYRMQGYLEMAIKKFKKSIKLNASNREVHIDLADTYHRLGDIDQTIHEWERIIKLWPDDYFSCYRLAQLFLTAGKSNIAVRYLRKALQIRPDYIDARRLLQQVT